MGETYFLALSIIIVSITFPLTNYHCLFYKYIYAIKSDLFFCAHTEYDAMNLDMLREVIPMLKQQLEKAQIDRNYVQLERVSTTTQYFYAT